MLAKLLMEFMRKILKIISKIDLSCWVKSSLRYGRHENYCELDSIDLINTMKKLHFNRYLVIGLSLISCDFVCTPPQPVVHGQRNRIYYINAALCTFHLLLCTKCMLATTTPTWRLFLLVFTLFVRSLRLVGDDLWKSADCSDVSV